MAQYNKPRAKYSDRNNDVFEVIMMADKNGNIVNTASGAANLNIAAGLLPGYSFEHIVGAVPSMAQNTSGSVWDINSTIYPWAVMNTAGTLTVTCLNGDVGSYVQIDGLDQNWDHVSETLHLTTLSTITTKQYTRIHAIRFLNGVTANANDVTISKNGTTVAKILSGRGKTSMAQFSVPRGYTAFITKGVASCAASADATVDMFVKYGTNMSYVSEHSFEVSGTGGQYIYDFTVPLKLPEYSDVDVRASVRSNNARITAAFDVILVANTALA